MKIELVVQFPGSSMVEDSAVNREISNHRARLSSVQLTVFQHPHLSFFFAPNMSPATMQGTKSAEPFFDFDEPACDRNCDCLASHIVVAKHFLAPTAFHQLRRFSDLAENPQGHIVR